MLTKGQNMVRISKARKTEKTVERLLALANALTGEQAKSILVRMALKPMTNSARIDFERKLQGVEAGKDVAMTIVCPDRALPNAVIRTLADSPILQWAPYIIEAALDPRGPFQSRDVLLIAASLGKEKAYFISDKGIPHSALTQAGYILSMAGFERSSHYNKETHRPSRVWKLPYHHGGLGLEERVMLFHGHLQDALLEVNKGVSKVKNKDLSMEDFI